MNIGKYSFLSTSITQINKDLSDITKKVSSEKSFDKGSEDINKFSIQLTTEKAIGDLKKINTDTDQALGVINASDNALNSIDSVMSRVYQELIKVSSNGQYSNEDRIIIKELLIDMKSEIIDISNSKYNGEYIFSGTFTDKKPFDVENFDIDVNTGRKQFTFSGTDTRKTVYVDENAKAEYGITGKELFGDSQLLSVLDNIIEIMEDPSKPVKNELITDNRDINNSFSNSFYVKERQNYIDNFTLTNTELNSLNSFEKNIQEFSLDKKNISLNNLITQANDLKTLNTFTTNPESIDKMISVATLNQELEDYNISGDLLDFDKAFETYSNLIDDNNFVTPFSDKEKEQFKFSLESASYSVQLADYTKEPNATKFTNMENTKNYLQSNTIKQEDLIIWNQSNNTIYVDSINLKNSNIQVSVLPAAVKTEYDTYNTLINTYLSDMTTTNKNAVDAQKTVLDGLGLGAIQDSDTQKIQNLVDHRTSLNTTWTEDTVINDEKYNKMESMFNLSKNPITNELEEWENSRKSMDLARARIGTQGNYFQQVSIRVSEQTLGLEMFYQENISTDLSQAALDLQNKSNSLNALYSIIAKIQDLSLTKYI
jgi:flagellin-like hook-associated protein FlgL